MSQDSMKPFDTVQYCIDNNVPCFTFGLNATKKVSVEWSKITRDNFKEYIHRQHNGFTIITGHTHVALDFDSKYNPPEEIKEMLMENCSAVEKSPSGYHFWFRMTDATAHLESATNIRWNNIGIQGLDLRAKKGLCHVAPSHYNVNGTTKRYEWIKGNLSTAEPMNDAIQHCIEPPVLPSHIVSVEVIRENGQMSLKITPQSRQCIVKPDHTHSQIGHSCFFIKKGKTCFMANMHCFSHGTRKLSKEQCAALVKEYWPSEEQEEGDEYTRMKDEFEQNNVKILNPIGFYTNVQDIWVFRDRNSMKIAYENLLLSDGSAFLDKWLKDATMRTYSSISFEDTLDPTVFRVPDPPTPTFRYQTYQCDQNPEAVPLFDEFIGILSNHNAPIKEYIIQWLAHLLQKPMELPGVALIFNGKKGVGKDTLGDFIGEHIIGNRYYQNYPNQLQYFDKHDTFKANRFLIKIEELSRKVLCDDRNESAFKASITSPNDTLNPKNGAAFNVKNTKRIIGTSNQANSINVEQNERRYVISVVSPEKQGDFTYWTRLRETLFCPSGARAIAEWLLERDISEFRPNILPENTYLKQLQEDTRDPIDVFMEQVPTDEYAGSDLYQLYREFCTVEGFYPTTNTKFSTQLSFLMENGTVIRKISRTRTKKGMNYVIK